MEGDVIGNLLNSLLHDRSQTDSRLRKNNNDALTDTGGVDLGMPGFGDGPCPPHPPLSTARFRSMRAQK
jgi:hypothetical protein